jgi:hypothetical protein
LVLLVPEATGHKWRVDLANHTDRLDAYTDPPLALRGNAPPVSFIDSNFLTKLRIAIVRTDIAF